MTQTLTTEQLRARAESLGLDFFIERRAGIWVKEWFDNGCTSATAEEVMMWSMLANREAQPVGRAEITKIAAELVRGDYLSKLWTEAEKSRHVDTHRLQNLLDELHDVMKVKAIAITRLLTAPPAPAVPPEIPLTSPVAAEYVAGWNACRAAMLAQPVSGGYKLVPAEPTEDMIAAAMNCDDVSFNADETFCVNFGNIYTAMLAAAPKGGNGA